MYLLEKNTMALSARFFSDQLKKCGLPPTKSGFVMNPSSPYEKKQLEEKYEIKVSVMRHRVPYRGIICKGYSMFLTNDTDTMNILNKKHLRNACLYELMLEDKNNNILDFLSIKSCLEYRHKTIRKKIYKMKFVLLERVSFIELMTIYKFCSQLDTCEDYITILPKDLWWLVIGYLY